MEREPNNQGRRAASRATKLRRRKSRMNFILLAGFAALIVLMILVTPKEPKHRATYSSATESGLIGEITSVQATINRNQLMNSEVFRVLRGSIETLIASLNQALNIPDIASWLLRFMEYSGLITVAAMVLVILLTYTFLQGGRRRLRLQLPGAVFTTVLWLAFSAFFEIFITRFWKASSLYGSLAAIFLAAMWLKSITMILFYGAALNEALLEQRAGKEKE